MKKIFCLIFFSVLLILNKTFSETIIHHNAFERKDVPKWMLYEISLNPLKIKNSLKTEINVTVREILPTQRNDANFEGTGDDIKKFYKIRSGFKVSELKPLSSKSSLASLANAYSLNLYEYSGQWAKDLIISKNNVVVSTIPLFQDNSISYSGSIFNNNKSIYVASSKGDLFIIKDISKPILERAPNVKLGWNVEWASSNDSKILFAAEWFSEPFPGETKISRIDPFGSTTKVHMTSTGSHAPGIFKFFPSLQRLVYRNSEYGSELDLIDSETGAIVTKLQTQKDGMEKLRFTIPRKDTELAVIGNHILDIKKGKFVGALPDYYGRSTQLIMNDRNLIVYSTQTNRDIPNAVNFTTINVFSFDKMKILGSLIVPLHYAGKKSSSTIEYFIRNGDNALLVFESDGGMYFDHTHKDSD